MALALTIARVLVFALAPMLELEHVSAPASVAAAVSEGQSPHGVPMHDSATCPACVLLHAHASLAGAGIVAFPATETHDQVVARVAISARSAPREGFQSRAPPRAFA